MEILEYPSVHEAENQDWWLKDPLGLEDPSLTPSDIIEIEKADREATHTKEVLTVAQFYVRTRVLSKNPIKWQDAPALFEKYKSQQLKDWGAEKHIADLNSKYS
jgi:hypothetical protein